MFYYSYLNYNTTFKMFLVINLIFYATVYIHTHTHTHYLANVQADSHNAYTLE